MDVPNTNTALLIQLLEQVGDMRGDIGGIKAQLEHGSRRHEQFDNSFETIKAEQSAIKAKITETVEPLVMKMADIEPKVTKLMTFMGRIGAILTVASAIIYGVMTLILASWKFILDWLLSFFRGHT